ncbi:hypothetical protein EOD39_7916 [Acipenser ruthenus]|uniref:Uncharacterized protein n=1 Tax=Acipenser ruthenus TaxID=7906 RepID=A0A662YX80_ACIRT|nr:hypothetical protein EOD39_7916 [Acipenser ruthenus]
MVAVEWGWRGRCRCSAGSNLCTRCHPSLGEKHPKTPPSDSAWLSVPPHPGSDFPSGTSQALPVSCARRLLLLSHQSNMKLLTLGPQDQPVLVKTQAASDGMLEVKAQDQLILHFSDPGIMPYRHLPQLKLQGCRQQLTIHRPELLPPSLPSPVQDISPHNDHRDVGVNET